MNDVNLFYDEYRNTWNVIVNGEWYYESTDYESASDIALNCCAADEYY